MDTHSAKMISWFVIQDKPVSPTELLEAHIAWTEDEEGLTRREIRDTMCRLIDDGTLTVNWNRKMELSR